MSSGKILFRLDFPHGPGTVHFTFQTGSLGNHLVTTGSDGTVAIHNRQGQLQDRIVLQALCTGMSWDHEGDILSIITNSSSQIILWDINTRQKQIVDTGLRDSLSCILWSKNSQILAVASTRGNLAIYNHQTTKRTPILGKHSKRITCGAWSKDNILALGSEDKTFSLSSEDGDSLRVIHLRDIPSDMCFAEIKTDERVPGENTVTRISMIIGKKTLYLYHLPEPDSPAELGFQHKYGSLLQHKWFGDGYILLGFSQGNVVAISTHPKEVGQELWQIRNHRDSLSAIAVSKPLEQIASCGDDKIKIHSSNNLQETISILTVPDQSGIKSMDWSVDGQLIAASTTQGSVYVFVTKMSVLSTVSFPRIGILSSLAEVSIYNYTLDKNRTPHCIMPLEIEPSVIAIGSFHFACGMNNHAWFYDLTRSTDDLPTLLGDREYIAEINDLKLNAKYCAALIGGRVSLHPITSNTSTKKEPPARMFPENTHGMQESVITSIILTSDFLIFSNDLGHLVFFSLEFWTNVVTYRHTMGIRSIYSDADGTKIAFIDDHNQGYVYCPSDEEPVKIPNFPKNCSKMLWDSIPSRTFVVFESKMCTTYVYSKYSINNRHVMKISETPILSEQTPLILYDSELCLATNDGSLSTIVLTSHLNLPSIETKDQLKTLIEMRRFDDAWHLCKSMNRPDIWQHLGQAAIAELDINFAMRVYRQMGNAATVYALKSISSIEDINFISGFCALLGDRQTDKAKTFFAKSVNPVEALDLCRDLLQWEQAAALAETLAPEQIPLIAREYAYQLEFTNRYAESLANYEKGLEKSTLDNIQLSESALKEHNRLCQFGIARTNIKLDNIKKGVGLAMQLNDKQLFEDCAEALIAMNETVEAARLFELAENWDQACQLYIQMQAWQKVHAILPHVSNPKMHAVYAKSCETEGNFNDAIEHYRNAGDLDSVVRIYVEHLADPHSAAEIVVETRSIEGSKLLAHFYQSVGDHEQALRFLILCGSFSEAYILAKKHNKIRQYAELLELLDNSDTASPTHFLSVAEYFENEKYTLLAGKYYYFAKEYAKALKHLLKASTFSMDENAALELAVDCAASSNDDKIANQLIEYLLGERDGSPKDPKYLFGLYMARKQFKEAAKTAVIISNQEQIAGNYRNAHDLLFSMYQELRKNNLSISAVMMGNLALLHRYTLVRTHVKIGDHHQAAKLLIQVAANISRFPAHTVPILTSTVIECHRVGFQKAAFLYASTLMRSEYRSQIDQKYAKKIEAIVRKAPNGIKDAKDSYQDESQACPICECNLQIMELTCHQCKTNLPMCIATGQHISKDDVVTCPSCDFLCFQPQMTKILNATNQCPMCSEIIDSNQLNSVINIGEYLNIS